MKTFWLVLILALVSGCTGQFTQVDELSSANIVQGTMAGLENWGTAWGPDAFQSGGERIFFTTINHQDEFLTYSGGPKSDMMMGGFLACASCHGPAGKGGTHEMYNYTMIAPDIRFITLNARKQGLTGTNPSSQSGKAGEYDIEDLNRALIRRTPP